MSINKYTFRKIFFEVHWYLGIFFSLFLFLVALSGAVLSFEKEIKTALNTALYQKENIKNNQFLPSSIIKIVKQEQPKARVKMIIDDQKSLLPLVSIMQKGEKGHEAMLYSINLNTKELKLLKGERMFRFMNDFHRRLLTGSIGSQIVALTSISLLVLITSGIYLYWGRLKRKFFKSFKIDFHKKGRAFLYQLHSALGMWLIPLYLITILSGLYWSYAWYGNIIQSFANVNLPISGKMMKSKKIKRPKIALSTYDDAWKVFTSQNIAYNQALFPLSVKKKIVNVKYLTKDSIHSDAYNLIDIHIKKNKVISHKIFNDLPIGEQIVRSMSTIHSGEFFGWIGRISIFIASLLLPVFVITGWMLYLSRRKKLNKFQRI